MDINKIELDDFKRNVKTWIILDDDIKKLEKALKELKKQKSEVTPKLEKFMSNHEIQDCKTGNGIIKCVTAWSKEGINRKSMQEKLSLFLKNMDLAEKATSYIYDNREKKSRVRIKRIIPKEINKMLSVE